MPISLTTAPTSYPINLSEAKDQIRELTADNDTFILNLIRAATDEAEIYCWRRFVTQTWTYYSDSFGKIVLPYGQLQSVSAVKYYDSSNVLQTLASSVYDVDTISEPGAVSLAYSQSWPQVYAKPNTIEIEYVCGYTSVPESIKQAIKIKVEMLFGNVLSSDMNSLQKTYESLLSPYRLFRF